VPGFLEFDTGRFASFTLSGQFETGYKFHLAGFDATPLASVQFTSLWMNGFTETHGAASVAAHSAAPRRAWLASKLL
jgi:outer membrane autotransporter protein